MNALFKHAVKYGQVNSSDKNIVKSIKKQRSEGKKDKDNKI